MKKALSLFIPIMLLLFPTVISAKSAQSTFLPLGISEGSHTYNNIPFQIPGAATLFVGVAPEGDPLHPLDHQLDTYEFGENNEYKANKIHFINYSAWALDFPNGRVVGEITVCYRNDTCDDPLELIIGVNTAEWAYALPWNIGYLGHTPPESAWIDWFYEDGEGPYPSHHFYASVDTNPDKVLDRIELELILDPPTFEYAGVGIDAITVETPEAPPKVTGGGVIPCGDGNRCPFGLNAKWKEGEAWPTAKVFFQDLDAELTFMANDIRRMDKSFTLPGGIFLTGWGQVNGEDGYRFNLHVADNGNPGAGNDIYRIRIISPSGEDYITDNQLLLGGNIKVKAN